MNFLLGFVAVIVVLYTLLQIPVAIGLAGYAYYLYLHGIHIPVWIFVTILALVIMRIK